MTTSTTGRFLRMRTFQLLCLGRGGVDCASTHFVLYSFWCSSLGLRMTTAPSRSGSNLGPLFLACSFNGVVCTTGCLTKAGLLNLARAGTTAAGGRAKRAVS